MLVEHASIRLITEHRSFVESHTGILLSINQLASNSSVGSVDDDLLPVNDRGSDAVLSSVELHSVVVQLLNGRGCCQEGSVLPVELADEGLGYCQEVVTVSVLKDGSWVGFVDRVEKGLIRRQVPAWVFDLVNFWQLSFTHY